MRWIAGLLLFAAGPSFAHGLWWTPLATYTYPDGSQVQTADVTGSVIEWSDGATFGDVHGSRTVNGGVASVTMPDPAAGESRCYRHRWVLTAAAMAAKRISSVPWSNTWCKVMPAALVDARSTVLSGN